MKVKVKLDANSIKEMAIEHVEKIGLGVVALIALFLVYSAFGNAKSYEKTPEQLKNAADNADRTIEQTTIEQAGLEELKVIDYAAIAKESRTPVQDTEYKTPVVWDNPLFEPKKVRDQPALFAATDLRATADFGALTENITADPEENPAGVLGNPAMGAGNMNKTEVRGEQWVALTALVPIKKQQESYIETFSKCRLTTQSDFPNYLDYRVERVEVQGPTAIDDIDWSKAKTFRLYEAAKNAKTRWPQTGGADIVEQKYLQPTLVFPLPQLVGKQWDEQVAHAPEIPLPSLEPGMGGTRPGMGPGMMGDGFMEGMPPGGNRGMMGRPGGGGVPPGMDPLNPQKPLGPDGNPIDPNAVAEKDKPQEYLLLRFLDFDVNPGKKYVYRVKLALSNPNHNLKPDCLANPKLAEKHFMETQWSDPTPVVSVPRATQVLAVSVEPARPNRDPSGHVMVAKWVQFRGFMAHEEFTVNRGQVINYADRTFRRVEGGASRMGMGMGMEGMMPRPMGPEGGMGMEGMMPPAGRTPPGRADRTDRNRRRTPPGRRGMEEFPPPGMGNEGYGGPMAPAQPGNEWLVNYYTEAIAVDFRGGERLTPRSGGDLDSVGEILLFDIDGNLIVHNELDDQPEREKITAAANPAAAGAVPGQPATGVNPRGALEGMLQQQQEPPPSNNRRRRR